jgi:hypothetical protein
VGWAGGIGGFAFTAQLREVVPVVLESGLPFLAHRLELLGLLGDELKLCLSHRDGLQELLPPLLRGEV